MGKFKNIKQMAKMQIKGKIGTIFLMIVVISLMIFVSSLILGILPGILNPIINQLFQEGNFGEGSEASLFFARVIPFLYYALLIFFIFIVYLFFIPAVYMSINKIFLKMAEGRKIEFIDLFCGFKQYWACAKVLYLSTFFVLLWSLLFIVPGIIKAYSYSQAMLIVAEEPNTRALVAIKRSTEMMRGYKLEYFWLSFSFIGWILLGYITLGIAYIWVIPYYYMTLVNFYKEIKPKRIGSINSSSMTYY